MEGTCPSCGTGNPAPARFCMGCGSSLAEHPPAEERRVVTILFVDLVGFTERSDRADPEDVRRTLVPFHRRVKDDLERHGGTLDKFIGDAVMGVFGAPVAHEDDPARAVLAALSILTSMRDLAQDDPNVAVRIAVHTGEAVVTSGLGPQIGEAVAGDVVNTASRMQSIAPRGGVVVGPVTEHLIRHRFELEELPPVAVKGKREALRTWLVIGERAPEAGGEAPSPMVGRREELARLAEILEAAEREMRARSVLLLAEPGMGKSRLLNELRRRLGERAAWFGGACLPYGEDVAFRALADVLRAAIGIDPGAEVQTARRKVAEVVESIEPSAAERIWLAGRLEALLGLAPIDPVSATPSRQVPAAEWAAASAQVVAHAAGGRPAVVVFEDVHWAEAALRETIGRLAAELADRPVLVVSTSRPDPAEGAEAWPGDSLPSETIRLGELTPHETSALLERLLPGGSLPHRTRTTLLERAGGNPLYALEFARMLSEPSGAAVPTADHIPMPDTVQAVIAARLDGIPRELRGILQDAAVVGTAVWPGAVDSLAGIGEAGVEAALDELVHRELLRRSPTSRLPGHPELAFTHALIREVAYARLPRAARARKHLAAGTWLEIAAGERAAVHADALAGHFARSHELAEAAGAAQDAAAARPPAVRWLIAAAELTARLDEPSAFAQYERALALAPEGTRERAVALAGSALTGRHVGALAGRVVLRRFEEALRIERELGDRAAVGAMLVRVGSQLGALGEARSARDALAEAVATLETLPPGRELARALAFRAEEDMFAGRTEESLAGAERALELAQRFGADDTAIMALHIRGDARCSAGDLGGLQDLEEAVDLAHRSGSAPELVTSITYVGEWLAAFEGPAAALRRYDESIAIADRRGVASQGTWARAHAVWSRYESGEWARALRSCDDLLAVGPEHLDLTVLSVTRTARSLILALGGRLAESDGAEDLVETARPTEELQALVPALVVGAVLAAARGAPQAARAMLGEFEERTRDVAPEYRGAHLCDAVRTSVGVGDPTFAERLVSTSRATSPRDRLQLDSSRAIVAEALGRTDEAARGYRDVAGRWRAFGCPREEAEALMGRARCLPAGEAEARSLLADAERILASLGARPILTKAGTRSPGPTGRL